MKYDEKIKQIQRNQQRIFTQQEKPMSNEDLQLDELTLLKSRATKMGISYHPSIGIAKLREKVNSRLKTMNKPEVNPVTLSAHKLKTLRRKEASRLVRVNVTCMNPAKKEWTGEIFTVSNSVVGTFKKFVLFNTPDGWHVPQIILNAIKERQFQQFVKSKGLRGNEVKQSKLVKEFAVEVLPPLTHDEITELARQQAMSQSIG